MPSPLTEVGAPRRSTIKTYERQLRDYEELYWEAAELCRSLWQQSCLFRELRNQEADHCRQLRRMREATSERSAETRDLMAS
jgi:hypothetical protein